MFCPESLCNLQSCSNFPNAQCVIDNCGQCKATFIENGTDVTDQCSKFYLNNINTLKYFYKLIYVMLSLFRMQCRRCYI